MKNSIVKLEYFYARFNEEWTVVEKNVQCEGIVVN